MLSHYLAVDVDVETVDVDVEAADDVEGKAVSVDVDVDVEVADDVEVEVNPVVVDVDVGAVKLKRSIFSFKKQRQS